jgi:hypothetical protein
MIECFYCGKEIDLEKDNGNIWNVAIERPYANLPFHKEPCLRAIEGVENEYLTENAERIYELADKPRFKKDEVKKIKRK